MKQLFLQMFSPPPQLRSIRKKWFLCLQVLWILLIVFTILHFIASIPLLSNQVLNAQYRYSAGISMNVLTGYLIVLDLIVSLSYICAGIFIFIRSAQERMALYTAFFLVAFGGTVVTKTDIFTVQFSLWNDIVLCIGFIGQACFFIFFYLFPDGIFVPNWTKIPAVCLLLLTAFVYSLFAFFPIAPFSLWLSSFTILWTIIFTGIGIFSQIYRYQKISTRVQRQQTKWVIFGLVAAVVVYLCCTVLRTVLLRFGVHDLLLDQAEQTLTAFCITLVPFSIGVAILRYRLWDVDLLINRTLVYGTLTACVVVLSVLIVGGLAALFQSSDHIFASLIATGLIAVLVQPLRSYLQHTVNRLMYGERDAPYTVLARLGKRLEGTQAPTAMLQTIVETLAQALKLPYAAITLKRADVFMPVATYDVRKSSTQTQILRLPLIAQNELVGEMMLASRSPDEVFTQADHKLLRDFAHQTGLTIQAARLTDDLQRVNDALQRSRERLVLAREEERRRIRRDLHDGLAPTLAALALAASTIGDLIPVDPPAAVALSHTLQNEIRTAIGDIRHIVYDLRPPALDQLGLVAAIHEHIALQTRSAVTSEKCTPLQITVQTPPSYSSSPVCCC